MSQRLRHVSTEAASSTNRGRLLALFTAAIWLSVAWIEHGLDRGWLIALGIGWAAATVLFEFGVGHWVAGHP